MQLKEDLDYIEKLEKELSVSVDNQILLIKKRRRVSKYSSASILAIITFLWMFPNQVVEHPLMQVFFGDIVPTEYIVCIIGLWLLALGITVLLWFTAVSEERIEREIVNKVKLESVQNRIFMNYLDNILPKRNLQKLDFMDYLSNGVNIVVQMKVKSSFIRRFHLREEVIQNMADIILLRAKEYGIIKTVKSCGLIECYEIIPDEE